MIPAQTEKSPSIPSCANLLLLEVLSFSLIIFCLLVKMLSIHFKSLMTDVDCLTLVHLLKVRNYFARMNYVKIILPKIPQMDGLRIQGYEPHELSCEDGPASGMLLRES